ncbi:MAG: HlyD family efflux transporter periplasmic adaptor subunit [bacterium]|nr:HlyD family efflux transporter periplasmic adaptor subunit [bacterium]
MEKTQLLFRWLKGEHELILRIYFLAFLQGLLYLAIPLGIQGIITYTMAGTFSASLVLLCGVTVFVVLFIGFFQVWQMRLNETLHEKIFGQLSSRISHFLKQTAPSELLVLKLNKYFEVVTLQKGISKILLDISFSIISIVFGIIILPLYSPWFMAFTLLLGFSFYFIVTHYVSKGISTNIDTSNQKYRLIEWFQHYSAGKVPANEESDARTEEILGDFFHSRKQHYHVLENQFMGIILFKIVFISILLFFGAYLVQRGDLNIGQFVASEIIIFLVINAVEKLAGSLNTIYDTNTALVKIEELFGNKREYSLLNPEVRNLNSVSDIYSKPYSRVIKYSLVAMVLSALVILCLPWTQNVQSEGRVSTLNPENRPQTITSRIGGRIEKWYIQEGDFVKKNDTIAFISEIKDEYIDPLLINRSEMQIKSKETSLTSYEKKILAVNSQIDALNTSLLFKIEQARNKIIQARIKVRTDSIEAGASAVNYKVAEDQLQRYEDLLIKGLVSKTDLENRRVKVQEALSKKTTAENKFMSAKNELLNAEIEVSSIQQDYQEKLMKAESDKFSTLSLLYEGEGALTKMQNQLANYGMRKNFYYVLAPQDGFIAKTSAQGIGEIVKEGAALCFIVPKQDEQAVELYVSPVDLPLIKKGEKVQLIFDGWPAFVLSGWPGISYGSYSAEIVAYDKMISENGKFRILARSTGAPWPEAIQIGGGVKGFALLNNVPLIYELWRQINGFPPEFYSTSTLTKKKDEQKK